MKLPAGILTISSKTPLQSIVGFSQAMSDGLGGKMSEQQDKYIQIIRKNSIELMYFVNKLMEFEDHSTYKAMLFNRKLNFADKKSAETQL